MSKDRQKLQRIVALVEKLHLPSRMIDYPVTCTWTLFQKKTGNPDYGGSPRALDQTDMAAKTGFWDGMCVSPNHPIFLLGPVWPNGPEGILAQEQKSKHFFGSHPDSHQ